LVGFGVFSLYTVGLGVFGGFVGRGVFVCVGRGVFGGFVGFGVFGAFHCVGRGVFGGFVGRGVGTGFPLPHPAFFSTANNDLP